MTITRFERSATSRRAVELSRLILPFLAAVGVGSACGPPNLVHTDGQPLAAGIEPVAIQVGWIGFDECEKGIHAVVELQAPAGPRGRRPTDLERLLLAVGAQEVGWPASVSVAGPFCPAWTEEPRRRGVRMGDSDERTRYWVGGGPGRECTYLVRAQFELSEIPPPGEIVQLVSGRRAIRLTRRDPP